MNKYKNKHLHKNSDSYCLIMRQGNKHLIEFTASKNYNEAPNYNKQHGIRIKIKVILFKIHY